MTVDQTHDPDLKSWVESANETGTDFPIQNLPFAVLRRKGSSDDFHISVAIGDYAISLTDLLEKGVLQGEWPACRRSTMNELMALERGARVQFRHELSRILAAGSPDRQTLAECLVPLDEVEYGLPAVIGDYTDFYTSIHHATNIGKLFRPDNPLLPNYEWVPIGYHGRSSSIGVTGQHFPRPVGQLKGPEDQTPTVGPCKRLDYELEVGIFAGSGNPAGSPVRIGEAEDHIFGLCLLNDWSARDVQAWEYQPLGPFLAKNFASTISPWVVTLEALAPFRAPFSRPADRPAPLDYLSSPENTATGAIDMKLEVLLETSRMKEEGSKPERLSVSNFTDSYWTMAQMLTHHTMNGCNMRPGDLFGSGTMSGAAEGSQGALIEITRGGTAPVNLSNGEQRTFLEDGDTVVLRARCERDGHVAIGFGDCRGTVDPAVSV